ncbi:MAG: TonB-dependent receptor [Sediminibacterium sp.]|nr:TonB-dependent receptor [Sediminibacterium sp.]
MSAYYKSQSIQLINKSDKQPIANAVARDKENKTAFSSARGIVLLDGLNKTDTIKLFCTGFSPTFILPSLLSTEKTALFEMEPYPFTLNEIVFSATRSEENKTNIPNQIITIDKRQIEFSNQQNSADLLQNTGQVFVQKSQMGGGSPVLRGFEANRVMLVVDGVRMNNAIYRGGHLQDVISLDPLMLDRVEVLFGPGATMYGSDALGGVMHFYTKIPVFSGDDKLLVKTNVMGRYSTVNREKTGHFDLNLGWKRFASLTNITFSSFDDLRTGSTLLNGYNPKWSKDYYVKRFGDRDSMVKNQNNRIQTGSAYQQIDIMQRFNYQLSEKLVLGFNGQLSTTGNVPRYDRLTEYSGTTLKFAEWDYGPQNRALAAFQLKNSQTLGYIDQMSITASWQSVDQTRISRNFNNPLRKTQEENVKVYGLNADFKSVVKELHTLHYGAEVNYNTVASKATYKNIVTNSVSPADTRYPDGGSNMLLASVYISDYYKVNDITTLHVGVRFNQTSLSSKFKDTTFFKFPYRDLKQNNTALSGHIGVSFAKENEYKVNFMGSSGFRAPNVDDMTKLFDSKAGSQVLVPNPDLKPEHAYNLEMSLSKLFEKKFQLDVSAWATSLEQAIVVREFKFNGADSIVYNGIKTKVTAMQNADRAMILGASMGFIASFNNQLSFKNTFTYTYGRYTDAKTQTVIPLDHIPPVFGQSSLIYKGRGFDGEFFVRYNGKKNLRDYSPSGEDNLQYATADGMPAWYTFNIRTGFNLSKYLRVGLACENIFDVHYRNFASGISAPGRNVIVSLKFSY